MALECSVILSPLDPGLTGDELLEVGRRANFMDGEITDALPHIGLFRFGEQKVMPLPMDVTNWVFFFHEDPDYRNLHAFDFVINELNKLVRSEGAARAAIDRQVLVERAVSKGFKTNDVQAAITWLVMAGQLKEKDGIISYNDRNGPKTLITAQLEQNKISLARPHRAKAYPIVKDIIERRSDGRAKYAEPLDAFADVIERLGYKPFRSWWMLMVAELRRADPSSASVSACVLAAALVEGALTFVVKHVRTKGMFQSTNYDKDPRTWKIEDLVASAASGGPLAILNLQTKTRAESLIRSRQRIHAGRMLAEFPAGPPDIRPEDARDAKATSEQVVRAILDWLEQNPA